MKNFSNILIFGCWTQKKLFSKLIFVIVQKYKIYNTILIILVKKLYTSEKDLGGLQIMGVLRPTKTDVDKNFNDKD